MSPPIGAAFTLEQCWHRVPGGTAVAALGLARALAARTDVELKGVSARHRRAPAEPWVPPIAVAALPLPRLALYESWHGLRRPAVERATGQVDVIHATTLAMPPRSAPLIVTLHDLAWVGEPAHFTARGVRFFRRGLELAMRDADIVLCSSMATLNACAGAGFDRERLRHVPLGVDARRADSDEIETTRRRYRLDRPYVLWTGTIEPRKNLKTLLLAFSLVQADVDLVLAGPGGWKEDLTDALRRAGPRVRRLGFVPQPDLGPLYAGAAVFCFPSLLEGFGFPVLEAMQQGAPVITSKGTSTEELAGDAGLLVDPRDERAIAESIDRVLGEDALAAELRAAGPERAGTYTWERTAELVVAAYGEVLGREASAKRHARDSQDGRQTASALLERAETRSAGRRRRAGESRIGINLLWMVPGSVGGTESYLARLLTGLAERPSELGYTLFVLPTFVRAHPELAAAFETATAPVSGRHRQLRVAAESSWLALECRRRGLGVVHHAGGIVPVARSGAAVLTIHDLQYLYYPSYFSATKLAYLSKMVPRSARVARFVLTPSDYVRTTVMNRLGVEAGKIRVIPHAISARDKKPVADIRGRYRLWGPFFLYPAIPYPHKNHIMLLEAFAELVARHPEASLVLTGAAGPNEASIGRHVALLGIEKQVKRLGHIPSEDLDALYHEATAMAFPSRFEGFGAPVLEAMSRGCPVIAANVTAVPEVIGEAGHLVDPDDKGAWAAAMEQLLTDDNERLALSKAGLERAGDFDLARSAAALEDAYRAAASAR